MPCAIYESAGARRPGFADIAENDGVKMSAIGDAVLTGLFSGQRKKDILEFVPGAQSAARIELVQSKTGARSRSRWRRAWSSVSRRRRLQGRGVERSINEGRRDLRRSCSRASQHRGAHHLEARAVQEPRRLHRHVTWSARAGSTVPEITSITGHSLASIYRILKRYLALDAELAGRPREIDWKAAETGANCRADAAQLNANRGFYEYHNAKADCRQLPRYRAHYPSICKPVGARP